MSFHFEEFPFFVPGHGHDLTEEDKAFLRSLKRGEKAVVTGELLFSEGQNSDQLYGVQNGMALRFVTTPGGPRAVNFVLPGDLVGLQSPLDAPMQYGVRASNPMVLAIYDRADLWRVFDWNAERGFDLTYRAAQGGHMLGEAVARIGAEGAPVKIAWCLHRFFTRALRDGAVSDTGHCRLPFRQQDMADALGLSLVHTNKTLARFKDDGIARWSQGILHVSNPARLAEIGLVAA